MDLADIYEKLQVYKRDYVLPWYKVKEEKRSIMEGLWGTLEHINLAPDHSYIRLGITTTSSSYRTILLYIHKLTDNTFAYRINILLTLIVFNEVYPEGEIIFSSSDTQKQINQL